MPVEVTLVVEGIPDETIASVLCRKAGVEPGRVMGRRGKGFIDSRLAGFNAAAAATAPGWVSPTPRRRPGPWRRATRSTRPCCKSAIPFPRVLPDANIPAVRGGG
jgi:hypothetical protein